MVKRDTHGDMFSLSISKLEKIVDSDLHADTELEKAQRFIDQIQTMNINNNSKEIEKIKKDKK